MQAAGTSLFVQGHSVTSSCLACAKDKFLTTKGCILAVVVILMAMAEMVKDVSSMMLQCEDK